MKTLIIIRHADAESHARSDFDRALTARGRSQMEAKITLLSDFQPDLIISSPAKRTTESAQIVAQGVSYPSEQILFDRELYTSDHNHYLNLAASMNESFDCIVIVGHNPSVSYLLSALLPRLGHISMRKSSFAVLEFDCESWSEIYLAGCTLAKYEI